MFIDINLSLSLSLSLTESDNKGGREGGMPGCGKN